MAAGIWVVVSRLDAIDRVWAGLIRICHFQILLLFLLFAIRAGQVFVEFIGYAVLEELVGDGGVGLGVYVSRSILRVFMRYGEMLRVSSGRTGNGDPLVEVILFDRHLGQRLSTKTGRGRNISISSKGHHQAVHRFTRL